MKLSRKTKNKLLKLAERLETVPVDQFDMGSWIEGSIGKEPCVGECGTTACAAGWATTIPAFKRAGLTLGPFRGTYAEPRFNGKRGFQALMSFFETDIDTVEGLFAGWNMPPRQYAGRLRQFVATGRWDSSKPR